MGEIRQRLDATKEELNSKEDAVRQWLKQMDDYKKAFETRMRKNKRRTGSEEGAVVPGEVPTHGGSAMHGVAAASDRLLAIPERAL